MKTEFRPIAMKCTKKQFLTIKDRITLPIDWICNFEYYTYLTNFYNGTETVTNIKESMAVNCIRESFHKFDGEFFLDCCGREIVEKELIWKRSEMQYRDFPDEDWKDCSRSTAEYRLKPKTDYTPEIEALQEKAKQNGMKVNIEFEKL